MAVDGDVLDLVSRAVHGAHLAARRMLVREFNQIPVPRSQSVATARVTRSKPLPGVRTSLHDRRPTAQAPTIPSRPRERGVTVAAAGPPAPSARPRWPGWSPTCRGSASCSAEDRSWVGMIVQAGIKGFVDWYRDARRPARTAGRRRPGRVGLRRRPAGAGRRDHPAADRGPGPAEHRRRRGQHRRPARPRGRRRACTPAVLRYAREVAFATAEVYARAAEVRGAWDARLEALVVDAVLRADADETLLSRASALGWGGPRRRRGGARRRARPAAPRPTSSTTYAASARAAGLDALCAIQGDRLVVVLGGVADPGPRPPRGRRHCSATARWSSARSPPTWPQAHLSARAALSAHRSAAGWPEAPRPVSSDDLLARAGPGRRRPRPAAAGRGGLPAAAATPAARWSRPWRPTSTAAPRSRARPGCCSCTPTPSATGCARSRELTGLTPTAPARAFTLQIALVLGRQSGR